MGKCNFCSDRYSVLRCFKCDGDTCGDCGYIDGTGWTCVLCMAALGPGEKVLRLLLEATLSCDLRSAKDN